MFFCLFFLLIFHNKSLCSGLLCVFSNKLLDRLKLNGLSLEPQKKNRSPMYIFVNSSVGREVNINGVAADVAATCVWEHSNWKLRIRNMYFCAIIYWRLQIAKLEIEAWAVFCFLFWPSRANMFLIPICFALFFLWFACFGRCICALAKVFFNFLG